ncbi:MAG: RraA family protein [Candidatus Bathyarchaeota archaeon]|nr:RraA family protein [Candidatus Bathyarchaeota archaeon]
MIDINLVEEKLTSSVLSDVLDGMGIRGQAMNAEIRPVQEDMVIVGAAHTMLMADQYDPEKDTFTLQFQAIDSLKEGDVMMVCSNGSDRAALWGELLSTAARYRGARGVIIDGFARDIKLIKEMRFPVFSKGVNPISSKGRVIAVDYDCPVEIGGVKIHPGDLVIADLDGVVVVPKDISEEAVEKALDVVDSETRTRDELKKGAGLNEVFKKYGTI